MPKIIWLTAKDNIFFVTTLHYRKKPTKMQLDKSFNNRVSSE